MVGTVPRPLGVLLMAVRPRVGFDPSAIRIRLKALQGVTGAMAAYVAEAGIPADAPGSEGSARPAYYMHLHDRGYFIPRTDGEATEVPARPWFTGTIQKQRQRWLKALVDHTPRIILGHIPPEVVMLKISHEMRNDLVNAIGMYGLIDTNHGRASVTQNVRRINPKTRK